MRVDVSTPNWDSSVSRSKARRGKPGWAKVVTGVGAGGSGYAFEGDFLDGGSLEELDVGSVLVWRDPAGDWRTGVVLPALEEKGDGSILWSDWGDVGEAKRDAKAALRDAKEWAQQRIAENEPKRAARLSRWPAADVGDDPFAAIRAAVPEIDLTDDQCSRIASSLRTEHGIDNEQNHQSTTHGL